MQLRKLTNHPYLFPEGEDEGLPEFGEHLIEHAPKMKFLSKLLAKVKA
jgi:hypothetical protein